MAEAAGILRFGLVGCGRIGRRHAEIISQTHHLVAVCDADPKRADDFAAAFNALAYHSFTSFIAAKPTCDVVVVATPNSLHAIQTILLLEAGYHVICEKPMALTAASALEMMNAARRCNRKLWVVKQNRFNPPVQLLQRMLASTQVQVRQVSLQCFWNRGEDYYSNSWKGSLRFDGGTLYTQFSHFIDVAIWLCGPLQSGHIIIASGNLSPNLEFEDSGVVSAKFASGALFSMAYSVQAFEKNMEGSLTLLTRGGSYKIGGEYLNTLAYQVPQVASAEAKAPDSGPNLYGLYTGSMSNHPEFYQQIARSLYKHAPEVDDLHSGFKTVEFIEDLYKSLGRQPADAENPDACPEKRP